MFRHTASAFATFVFVLACFTPSAKATAQEAEVLILGGAQLPLHSEPLAPYLASFASPPAILDSGVLSTGNWRGYVATWEIRGDSLWLAAIQKEYWVESDSKSRPKTEMRDIALSEIGISTEKDAFARWFTGTLNVPRGNLLKYEHMAWWSVYEETIKIEIDSGIVTAYDTLKYVPDPKEYISEMDRARRGSSRMTVDTGNWIDLRITRTTECRTFVKEQDSIRTRGILSIGDPPLLSMPETEMTEGLWVELSGLPDTSSIADGSFVEVTGRIFSEDGEVKVKIHRIRELADDETIHSGRFPLLHPTLEFWRPDRE